jgi:hypothetical protein
MSNQHGGAGRGQGRKPSTLNKYLIVIRCTPAEREIIRAAGIKPEQAAQALIQLAQANTGSTGR